MNWTNHSQFPSQSSKHYRPQIIHNQSNFNNLIKYTEKTIKLLKKHKNWREIQTSKTGGTKLSTTGVISFSFFSSSAIILSSSPTNANA